MLGIQRADSGLLAKNLRVLEQFGISLEVRSPPGEARQWAAGDFHAIVSQTKN